MTAGKYYQYQLVRYFLLFILIQLTDSIHVEETAHL
jgi:hypothetical protein